MLPPGNQLNEKVICNNLLDWWWPLRFDPGERPLYLTFTEVDSIGKRIVSRIPDNKDTLEDG